MYDLYGLKEKLCRELEEYGKKDLNMTTLDTVDKLAHAAKNVDKLAQGESRNSYRTMPAYDYENRGYGGYRDSYRDSYRDDDYSNRRRRDSRGRYSGHDSVEDLRDMMRDMPAEVQGDMQKIIEKLEQK